MSDRPMFEVHSYRTGGMSSALTPRLSQSVYAAMVTPVRSA